MKIAKKLFLILVYWVILFTPVNNMVLFPWSIKGGGAIGQTVSHPHLKRKILTVTQPDFGL